jgi:hypothetical protein
MPKASIQDAPAGLCSRQQEPDHGKNKAVQQPNRATNKADSKKKKKILAGAPTAWTSLVFRSQNYSERSPP